MHMTVYLQQDLVQKLREQFWKRDFGCMVGTRNQEIIRVPLSEVAGKLKYVDPKASIIDEAKTIGISFGDE